MKRLLQILAALLGVPALLLLVAYLVMDREKTPLNDDTIASFRSQFGGVHSFATLPQGRVHYQWSGGSKGKVLVLIHGVSGPMSIWQYTYSALRNAGYRVLRLDLYGRGLSQRTKGPYDLALYRKQVLGLLKHLKIKAPIALLGSSMGAIVSTDIALSNEHPVERLILLGPAGFPLKASALAKLIHVPGVGDYIMRVLGHGKLMEHNHRYFHDSSKHPKFLQAFEKQLQIKGSKAAILSTMRHVPVQGYLGGYRKLGRRKLPVLLVWGKQDRAFPFAHHKSAQAAMPQARLLAVDKAGHLPHMEQPLQVNQAILSFLKSPPKN